MERTVIGLVALALAVVACGGPEGVSSGPDLAMLVPTDPKLVLINICYGLEYRHRKILRANLCDDFIFYFDPSDVGAVVNGYVIPKSWTLDEFYAAADNIFAAAYDVEFSLSYRGIGTPGPGETEFRAEDVNTNFEVMVDENRGYATFRGFCDFEFRGYAPGDGKTYWRIYRWWDRTYVEPSDDYEIEETTLGRILAMYHNPNREAGL
jgi:hypothetical protein